MRILIEPNDVWLFRDGRPFSAGDDHHASSLFPPPISTLEGALRAACIAAANVHMDDYVAGQAPAALAQAIGAPDAVAAFGITAVYVRKGDKRYLPMPTDAYSVDGAYRPLAIGGPAHVRTNLPTGLQLLYRPTPPVAAGTTTNNTPSDQHDKHRADWVEVNALHTYLTAPQAADRQIAFADTVALCDLFERESRYGIHLDYGLRRPYEGALYEAEFLRMQDDVGIEIDVSDLPGLPESGLLKLGGEGKLARYRVLARADTPPILIATPPSNQFRLYCVTPACFDEGWRPSHWDGLFPAHKPTLIAAAVPRFEARGGFDMFNLLHTQQYPTEHRPMHRPSRRYVPAGSVFVFKCDPNKTADAADERNTQVVVSSVQTNATWQMLMGR